MCYVNILELFFVVILNGFDMAEHCLNGEGEDRSFESSSSNLQSLRRPYVNFLVSFLMLKIVEKAKKQINIWHRSLIDSCRIASVNSLFSLVPESPSKV